MGSHDRAGKLVTAVFLVVLVFTAVGCVGLPMACSDLQAESERLRTLPIGSMPRAELRQWASQTYGVAEPSISSSFTSDGAMNVSWTVPGWARYVARFPLEGEAPVERLDVYWSRVNLTAARTVECLGVPGAYNVYVQTRASPFPVIQLWYPDRNVAVQSFGVTATSADGKVSVDGSLVMTGMVAELPAGMAPVTSTPALLRAWPGTWPGAQAIDRLP